MGQRILIAAGGTGGHIYPALAIAKSLRQKGAEVHFVGTPGALEKKLIPAEDFPLHIVNIGRLNSNVSLAERLKTLVTLPFSILKAFFIILKLRPSLVLGVGGAVSGPVLLAASLMRKRTFIWEPNAYPGMANRILSSFVDESLLVYEESGQRLKSKSTRLVGMPIRSEIEAINAQLPGSQPPLKVLVFGGSQGSRPLNNVVSQAVAKGGDWLNGVEIVHQTGQLDFNRISAIYSQLHKSGNATSVKCFEYLNDMDKQYTWADLVVSRCGTGTISELAACGQAAVLVPLPNAADNHQQKNAEVLVRGEAAVMVLQKDFIPEKFVSVLEEAMKHPEHLTELAKNIKKFHKPRAAEDIADHLLQASGEL